ncbi:MAG: hypothetical protein ACI3ZQ_04880 [Candidatus Cryptobacteroides sp.]
MDKNFSFKKGWVQLRSKDQPKVRTKIINALGLKCVASFYPRLNGAYEPRVTEAKAIETIFAEYGITDVWGNA